MREPEVVRAGGSEEVVEPGPIVVAAEIVARHGRGELQRERLPQHGDAAQEAALAGRQPVDLRRDHGLDGVRHLTIRVPGPGEEQLPQEQRVAAGALGHGGDLVVREVEVRHARLDERRDGVGRERRELEAEGRGPGGLVVLGRNRAAGHAQHPALVTHPRRHLAQHAG
jgi:hypothetical protein